MSNAGQAALTIVGTAVGATFGNPQLGYLLGNLAGQALFPTQLPGQEGPRLADLTVQSSAIGAPIPIVYGTYAVAGNVIWSSGLIESSTTEEVGGKGGGPTQDVTTYSYTANWAVGVCEGVISGVRRIWADAKLVYDVRAQLAGESDQDYTARVAASEAFGAYFTVYTGTSSQVADPTIESFEGSGEVSGFRGLAYLVFADVPLADYGNRIPNLRIEVYIEGLADCVEVTEYDQERLYPWAPGSMPLSDNNEHEFTCIAAGRRNRTVSGVFDSLSSITAACNARTGKASGGNYHGYSIGERTFRGTDNGYTFQMGAAGVAQHDVISLRLHYNMFGASLGTMWRANEQFRVTYLRANAQPGTTLHCNGPFAGSPSGRSETGVYLFLPSATYPPPYPEGYQLAITSADGRTIGFPCLSHDMVLQVTRVLQAPPDPCAGGTLEQFPGYCIDVNGFLTQGGAWTRTDGTWRVLQKYRTGLEGDTNEFSVVTQYPLGPARPLGHPEYSDQAFWEDAYALAVARGDLPEGMTYPADYPESQTYAYQRTYQRCSVSVDAVSVGSIVRDLCQRAGLAFDQIDVTDLTKNVRGYAIGRVTTARAAIEPLQSYAFFDGCETDGRLRFVTRGGPDVATLSDDDIGVHPFGSERPAVMEIERAQDVDLPRRLRLHYAQPDRDYEPGEQGAQRLTSRAVQVLDVDLPIAMSDEEAAQIAEVLLFDLWLARSSYRFTLDQTWLGLEPTDVVTVPIDGFQERVRIVSIDHQLPGLLRIEASRDDDGSYVSYAVGASSDAVVPALTVRGPTDLVVLDLPALRDADSEAGYYAAARGLLSSSGWPGAAILRSSDNGASFLQVGSVVNETTMGEVLSPLGVGDSTVFDYANTLLVRLYVGTLESRTEAAVLAGANAAAIGADGRWEIVQFVTATQDGEVWRLTGLLRGRKGTEAFIGESLAGDRFVMISTGTLVRLPLEVSNIGTELILRGATLGVSIDYAEDIPFTGRGVALKPYSPAHLKARLTSSGTLLIEWIRRGRLGEELRSGTDIALSEETESYDVEVVEAGVTVASATVSVQEYEASLYSTVVELQLSGAVLGAAWMVELGGELYGITDSFYTPTSVALLRFDAEGERLGGMGLGTYCVGVLAIGSLLYLGIKTEGSQARVVKVDPADVIPGGTLPDPPDAEYEPAGSTDLTAIAYDGTNLWAYLQQSASVVRLNLTTLAVETTIGAVAGGYQMAAGGGSLWILAFGSVTEVDSGGVVQTFPVVDGIYDVLYADGLVFVHGTSQVGVYQAADGAQVALHDFTLEISAFNARKLATDGTDFVVFCDPATEALVFLSRTTGLEVTRRPVENADRVVGYAGGAFYVGIGGSTAGGGVGAAPFQTVGIAVAARGPYEISVWQRSAIVGRGTPAELTIEVEDLLDSGAEEEPTQVVPDPGAILVPLTVREDDNFYELPWVRTGEGPRVSPLGWVGDGYGASLKAASGGSPGLPSWITTSGAALTIRATMRVDYWPRTLTTPTRDVILAVGANDSNERPKLEFVARVDTNSPLERDIREVAVRSYTGSLQSHRLFRNTWRYEFRTPEEADGINEARPQALCFLPDGQVLFTVHFNETLSRAYVVDPDTQAITGRFDFDLAYTHVACAAIRPSDDSLWVTDYAAGVLLEIDLEASLLGGEAVVLREVGLPGGPGTLGSLEWLEVDGSEWLLTADFDAGTSGWLYQWDPADLVGGATLVEADRIKRLIAPALTQGMVYRDADETLFVSCSTVDGTVRRVSIATWIRTGSDGQNYTTYALAQTDFGPGRRMEDCSFDTEGRFWVGTEGSVSVGDFFGWSAAWSSALDGPEFNNATAEYDGAGSVLVKLNDQDFETLAWTPTISPDQVTIGGLPFGAASQDGGHFLGVIRNVVLSPDPISYRDPNEEVIYEVGELVGAGFPIVNAGAELGDTSGWTNEVGALGVRSASPDPYDGSFYFTGGTDVTTRARQRFTLAELGVEAADVDTGTTWCLAQWRGANFSAQNDTQAVGFRFLDENGAELAYALSPAIALEPPDVWIARSFGVTVPAGTRSVDLVMEMTKGTGANNDGFVDVLEASLYRRVEA